MKEKVEEIKNELKPENDEPVIDIPYAKELGLSKKDIEWIRSVKDASMKLIEEQVEGYRKKGLNPLTREIKTIKAWDLVLVHLMMLRDLKKYGPEIISNQTEKKLDEILAEIFTSGYYFESFNDSKQREESLEGSKAQGDYRAHRMYTQIIGCMDDYKRAKDAKDKAAILSRVLNIWHIGGSNIVFNSSNIDGVPYDLDLRFNGDLPPTIAQQDRIFLERLNNLGRDAK